MRFSSLSEGPLGSLSPVSHFCTVDTLAFSTAANTAWLTRAFFRRDNGPGAAPFALAGYRHALIHNISTKVRIDQALGHLQDRSPQRPISHT